MNKPKILVADDIKQNVKLLRVILVSAEYDVVEAYDGEEALSKAGTEKPDLILLDIMMPKMTGYEVCQKLRMNDATKDIPVVMITALHEKEDKIKGIEAGANDFISKPFVKAELLARVKSLLRMRPETAGKEETVVLDAVLADLAEGVIVVDDRWKIKNINRTAREYLNMPESDNKNTDLSEHLSHLKLSVPLENIKNPQERVIDFQIISSNNQYPENSNVRLKKIFDEGGNMAGIALIIRKAEKG
jgi:DNA-binding response OmpR family regulator